MLKVRFLGTGTPIGAGGLLQSCIALETANTRVLLDCGMTSMVALHRGDMDPDGIDAVIISHLHGDHFGGLPLLLLDASMRRRTRPLLVAGPPSTAPRLRQALADFGWTGTWEHCQNFLNFGTLRPREPADVADLRVTAYPVPHYPGTEPTAIRLEHGDKVIAYSGDAGWSSTLLEAAESADLFICAVWSFDEDDPSFLDYRTFRRHQHEFRAKRILLTHLGPPMLDRLSDVQVDNVEVATDGLWIDLL